MLAPHASAAAIEARNDIYNLWRAFKHNTVARLLDVYTHAELTGLGMSCFAKVCFLLQPIYLNTSLPVLKNKGDIPDDAQELGKIFYECVSQVLEGLACLTEM